MVMKFCGWIDLIKGECSAHESLLLSACFLSYCPFFIFILDFCPEYISETVLAMGMKFCGWIDLIKFPLFIFILEFCLVHISKNILAMVMKFLWVDRSH